MSPQLVHDGPGSVFGSHPLQHGRADADRLLFCLDGVHGFGVEDANFEDFGCDYFIAGTHKWLFGPSGTGIICSRTPQLDEVSPTIPPFNLTGEEGFGAEIRTEAPVAGLIKWTSLMPRHRTEVHYRLGP